MPFSGRKTPTKPTTGWPGKSEAGTWRGAWNVEKSTKLGITRSRSGGRTGRSAATVASELPTTMAALTSSGSIAASSFGERRWTTAGTPASLAPNSALERQVM